MNNVRFSEPLARSALTKEAHQTNPVANLRIEAKAMSNTNAGSTNPQSYLVYCCATEIEWDRTSTR